ncbi:acyltransferase family protein [Marinobacter alexandrii]|jgi:peptidoglycan/LPS O-acetylase OafA/YrhL|uniref:acyltransferase family protein n=1 Tax=Marinobacter alexandrii TaxID=2570351 RepID=UPI00200028EF|nr:acyltransferase [Marinobacter alexandrii]MCK2147769.1 acyltransferase [Marinobacter alexandrii]
MSEAKSVRLRGPDGLRGIAALWVVLFHIWGAIQRRDTSWVPSLVQTFLDAGFLGVDIFFVLSGFVITYSLAGKPIGDYFVPKFILRRSIRIDPPYWATIVMAIVFIVAKNIFFPEYQETLPSFESVIAHIFYLQDLLNYPAISSVFWTLCLEFQFYIIFSIMVWLIYRKLPVSAHRVPFFVTGFSFIVMVVSPYFRYTEGSMPVSGTIFPYLYEFLLGILACYYLIGRLRGADLSLLMLTVFLVTVSLKTTLHAIIPAITVVALIGSSKGWRCFQFLVSDSCQFLGRISYSLYLTHAIIGWASASILIRFLDGRGGFLGTAAVFFLSVMVSLIFAYIFYHIVEKRFITLSKRLKIRGRTYEKCES